MPKCDKSYPNCQWTVTHCWPHLSLDTVLLTKVYWSYSKHVARLCFTPLLKPTLNGDLKRKTNVQITFNSPAMASLYERFCYHSLEHFNPKMNEFLTFILSTLCSPSPSPAISTVLPEATDANFNEFKFLQCIPLTNFGMCNPNTTEYFRRKSLVKA